MSKQCEIAGLSHSSFNRGHGESEENLSMMWLIDEQYSKRSTLWLTKDDGGAEKDGL